MPVPQRTQESEMGALQMNLTQAILDLSAKDGYIGVLTDYIQRLERFVLDKFGTDALVDFGTSQPNEPPPNRAARRHPAKRTGKAQ